MLVSIYKALSSGCNYMGSKPNLSHWQLFNFSHFNCSQRPWCCTGQPAYLSQSCCCTQPFLFFFYMRQLKSIKQSLTPEAMKTLVYAFISNRVNYCNSVFTSISGELLQRLQAIQNAADRLITEARGSQHVTSILCQLHWLPTRQHILFKTAVLVYKCRHGMARSYLSTYWIPTSSYDGWCHLRSAVSEQLSVPCTTTNYGDSSFVVSRPIVWNSLPAALWLDMSLSVFWRRLKTFFMTKATDSV